MIATHRVRTVSIAFKGRIIVTATVFLTFIADIVIVFINAKLGHVTCACHSIARMIAVRIGASTDQCAVTLIANVIAVCILTKLLDRRTAIIAYVITVAVYAHGGAAAFNVAKTVHILIGVFLIIDVSAGAVTGMCIITANAPFGKAMRFFGFSESVATLALLPM